MDKKRRYLRNNGFCNFYYYNSVINNPRDQNRLSYTNFKIFYRYLSYLILSSLFLCFNTNRNVVILFY